LAAFLKVPSDLPLRKYLATGLGLLLGFGFFASYCFPWQGEWVDRLTSSALSYYLRAPVTLKKVKVIHASNLDIGSLAIDSLQKETILTAEKSAIHFDSLPWPKSVDISLSNVSLKKGFQKTMPLVAWPLDPLWSRPIQADTVRFRISEEKPYRIFHLLHWKSKQWLFSGSLKLKEGQPVKGHVLIFLRENELEKVPANILSRMIKSKKGWMGCRIVLKDNTATLYGAQGPLLQFTASWKKGVRS